MKELVGINGMRIMPDLITLMAICYTRLCKKIRSNLISMEAPSSNKNGMRIKILKKPTILDLDCLIILKKDIIFFLL